MLYDEIFMIPDSESRRLDKAVQRSEMPYGYETPPPPADQNNGYVEQDFFKSRKHQ